MNIIIIIKYNKNFLIFEKYNLYLKFYYNEKENKYI